MIIWHILHRVKNHSIEKITKPPKVQVYAGDHTSRHLDVMRYKQHTCRGDNNTLVCNFLEIPPCQSALTMCIQHSSNKTSSKTVCGRLKKYPEGTRCDFVPNGECPVPEQKWTFIVITYKTLPAEHDIILLLLHFCPLWRGWINYFVVWNCNDEKAQKPWALFITMLHTLGFCCFFFLYIYHARGVGIAVLKHWNHVSVVPMFSD